MRFPVAGHRFLGFFPPYRRLEVLDHPYQIPRSPLPNRGSVLLWNLKAGEISPVVDPFEPGPPVWPSSSSFPLRQSWEAERPCSGSWSYAVLIACFLMFAKSTQRSWSPF